MKKIYIVQNVILEIAKLIKVHFPKDKVYIKVSNNNIIIKFPKNVDKLLLEELKTNLKLKYPYYNFLINFY